VKLLVTGGCGFIGQHLVELALELKHEVWVIDSKTRAATGWDKVSLQIGEGLILGDICESSKVVDAIYESRPDVVMHLAAQSHVDDSLDDPAQTMRVNAMGTQVVAAKCAEFGIPMVYCSTDEVYGDSLIYKDNKVEVIERTEGDPLHPSSPYSAGKAAGEMAVRAMGRSFGLRYVITRGCNAWGDSQYQEKLVPIACRLLNHNKTVPLHGGGAQIRQWIHVSEFAERLLACAEGLHDGRVDGDTFNIAGPTRCTVKRLVTAIAQVAGVENSRAMATANERPGQDMAYALSGEKLDKWAGLESPVRDILDEAEIKGLLDHYVDSEVRLAGFVNKTNSKEVRCAT
jgi:dTDP-glucose 4,6-dehydratase